VLGSKTGLKHCLLVPASIPAPDECSGYKEWASIPWDHLINLSAMEDNIRVKMIQWDRSPIAQYMKQSHINIFEADMLTL
jgi:hypothetical protein